MSLKVLHGCINSSNTRLFISYVLQPCKSFEKNKVFDESVNRLTRPCHLERSEKPLAHDPEVGSNLLSVNAVGEKAIKDVSLSLNMTSVM